MRSTETPSQFTKDTTLVNGVTLGVLIASYRRDLAGAHERYETARRTPAAKRKLSLRAAETAVAAATGKLQGALNALTLIGVKEEVLAP